jgi:hypothetical protein
MSNCDDAMSFPRRARASGSSPSSVRSRLACCSSFRHCSRVGSLLRVLAERVEWPSRRPPVVSSSASPSSDRPLLRALALHVLGVQLHRGLGAGPRHHRGGIHRLVQVRGPGRLGPVTQQDLRRPRYQHPRGGGTRGDRQSMTRRERRPRVAPRLRELRRPGCSRPGTGAPGPAALPEPLLPLGRTTALTRLAAVRPELRGGTWLRHALSDHLGAGCRATVGRGGWEAMTTVSRYATLADVLHDDERSCTGRGRSERPRGHR